MKVRELMVGSLLTCRSEDTLCAPARAMWDGDCGSIPVVDGRGKVVGMVTDRDICMAAYTQGRRLEEIHVEDIMCKRVVTCRADDDLEDALTEMGRKQLRRLPVVDAQGTPVGLLSLNDVARAAKPGRSKSVKFDRIGRALAEVCQLRSGHKPHRVLEPGLVKLSEQAAEIC